MKKILEFFEDFSKCSRASGNTTEARDFLIAFCRARGANIRVDKAGNILAALEKPKICLQAHYDMVAIGDHPPKIAIGGEWITAVNGTLGADNGIAVAAMLALIDRGAGGEYLFTNDEEIGLLGARDLEVLPTAKYIINLDGENNSEIIVGCAGGIEYYLEKKIDRERISEKDFLAFKIEAKNCLGGHSGVDIGKNITSAIAAVSEFIKTHNAKFYSFNGGERMNSIPKSAEAIAFLPNKKSAADFAVAAKSALYGHIAIESANIDFSAIAQSEIIADLLNSAPHGVFETKNGSASQSSNFAKIETKNDRLFLSFFARANSENGLNAVDKRIRDFAKKGAFDIEEKNRYGAWENNDVFLVGKLTEIMASTGQAPRISVMHAGLECGMLKNKLPLSEIVSIGMRIESPHSYGERVYIKGIEQFAKLLDLIVNGF